LRDFAKPTDLTLGHGTNSDNPNQEEGEMKKMMVITWMALVLGSGVAGAETMGMGAGQGKDMRATEQMQGGGLPLSRLTHKRCRSGRAPTTWGCSGRR
jgi:hypothetical protein